MKIYSKFRLGWRCLSFWSAAQNKLISSMIPACLSNTVQKAGISSGDKVLPRSPILLAQSCSAWLHSLVRVLAYVIFSYRAIQYGFWVGSSAILISTFAFGGVGEETVRVGFFPNITHAQALIAANMTREGKGWFEPRLGNNVKVEWFVFNAGPSTMEAIFAKSIDLTYVGPSPALNAYLRSNGEEIRVLSAAAWGGDALVVRNATWKSPNDLRGKIVSTPQLGNTQDVACRAWFIQHGLRVTLTGGDVRVIPMDNPSIFAQFSNGSIDGAWTVEPWVSRLLREANGHVLYVPKGSLTTVLVSSVRFLEKKPELARKFLAAHQELTNWMKSHAEEAQKRVADELSIRMRTSISSDLIRAMWQRLDFSTAIDKQPFEKMMADAYLAGLIRIQADLSKLIEQPSSTPAP